MQIGSSNVDKKNNLCIRNAIGSFYNLQQFFFNIYFCFLKSFYF